MFDTTSVSRTIALTEQLAHVTATLLVVEAQELVQFLVCLEEAVHGEVMDVLSGS